MPAAPSDPVHAAPPSLATVAREWTRIGCVGFGGPPAHVALFRELCVERRSWIDDAQFEDAIAATNLLPGPASTQLAIFCGWKVAGPRGAVIGGLGFILPGLVLIIGLAAVFLSGVPPRWIRGAGAAAGAAVVAVAAQAAWALLQPGWHRTPAARRARWLLYVAAGGLAALLIGVWLVVVLLACGAVEWAARRRAVGVAFHAWPVLLAASGAVTGSVAALAWTAVKVGGLSYGGGFVIIPLMRADALSHGWMTSSQFLSAVALGQVTPGPVVHTVAVVGYAAAGVSGALMAAALAFAPSFAFILLGATHFDRLRQNVDVRAFLDGAGPAAMGAILGSAALLASALQQPWEWLVLAAALMAIFAARAGVVTVLVAAGVAGGIGGMLGIPLPSL